MPLAFRTGAGVGAAGPGDVVAGDTITLKAGDYLYGETDLTLRVVGVAQIEPDHVVVDGLEVGGAHAGMPRSVQVKTPALREAKRRGGAERGAG